MSNTIIRPKTREEWLQVRQGGIGSSEIATIVGLNPWETPYQLWRRKMGLDPAKEETFAMKAGHYLEDAVSLFWQDETGQQVIKASKGDWIIRDNDRPYLQVSPDRTYWIGGETKNQQNKGILECKTTQKEIDEDDVPKHWFCQLQYQLGVGGYREGSLAWLSAGRTFGYKEFDFVEDFYGWLVEEADKFWTDHILGKKEPQLTNVRDVLLKFNRHTDGKDIEVDEETFKVYEDLKEVRAELDPLVKRKEELEDRLKMAFMDAEGITYGGDLLATYKAPKPSRKFDAKAFQAENPELAERYTSEQQGARRLLLK